MVHSLVILNAKKFFKNPETTMAADMRVSLEHSYYYWKFKGGAEMKTPFITAVVGVCTLCY